MLLNIEHTTVYRYSRPVRFGPHRLMVRAIESHEVQIRGSGLEISAPHRLRWLRDVFDNSVAVVEFTDPAADLRIASSLQVEQYNIDPFDFILDPSALEMPFRYDDPVRPDVAPYLFVHHPADEAAIRGWIRPFLGPSGRGRTMDFFTALIKSMPLFFQYVVREELGVQSPAQTISRRAGSCRDFALLFMEAARHLGVAARYVSGYLCRADAGGTLAVASDTTHAWAELYLPGAGWKGFDPTCGILAADHHVRTAVTRTPDQAVPVAGTFEGRPGDYRGMEVRVRAVRVN